MKHVELPPRPPTRRKPLSDATHRANILSTPPRHSKLIHIVSSSPGPVPHHESLNENGMLSIPNATDSPRHKRVSEISEDCQEASKRDSQISTASTNASATGRRRKTHIGPWQLGKVLGKGGCGRVRLVKHRFTGTHAAAKIISKKTAEKLRPQSLANLVQTAQDGMAFAGHQIMPLGIEREMVIMKLLEHPNVVRLYDVWENRNEIYLIMEYVDGGELFDYITGRDVLGEDEVVYLFRQIIAALLHCHRLNIHHRDLKPENILLDHENMTVKLVDFGMAALQPRGRFLSTPCGSPHYAAPEVLSGQHYNGAQADIWSCGVILYVMLTSTTPFSMPPDADPRNLEPMFKSIKAAKYCMPSELSPEAKDIIHKILQPDPNQRPSLRTIWEHPFLHKYDSNFGLDAETSKVEHWIGPSPVIGQWSVKRKEDIDREILRNLRTLWHSETEHNLVRKLLNEEPNEEKYIYLALLKHREEQLENYVQSPEGMGYSTSDYHHDKPVTTHKRRAVRPKSSTHKRSYSQFSILNNEHLNSSPSLYQSPPSAASYEPFRASRDLFVGKNGEMTQITVRSAASRNSSTRKALADGGILHPSSLRIAALRKESLRSSVVSGNASSRRGHGTTTQAGPRKSISRPSMHSSLFPSSPPLGGYVRPRSSNKRGVSFSHMRRSSTASALTGADSLPEPHSQKLSRNTPDSYRASFADSFGADHSSPVAKAGAVTRPLKDALSMPKQRTRTNKTRISDQYIDHEARKVSTELGMLCEEAFGSSLVSSTRDAATDKPSPYDTPPTSVSNHRGSGPPSGLLDKTLIFRDEGVLQSRPLPAIPVDTPNTFVKNEIAEARNKIAARRALESNGTSAGWDEILGHLDQLLKSDLTQLPGGDGRRTSSAPAEVRESANINYLPMISEEDSDRQVAAGRNNHSKELRDGRSATDPVRQAHGDWLKLKGTIRVIEPESSALVAPLNIRKVSDGSERSKSSGNSEKQRLPASQENYRLPPSRGMNAVLAPIRESQEHNRQSTIIPVEPDLAKKKNWFSRRHKAKDGDSQEKKEKLSPTQIPEQWQDLDDRETRRKFVQKKQTTNDASTSSDNSEFPTREGTPGESKSRKGLMKIFGKNTTSKKNASVEAFAIAPDADELVSLNSALNAYSPTTSRTHHPAFPDANDAVPSHPIEVQQSWLSRILHIKPASKILCFRIPRGKLRAELARLLRAWAQYGVRDVSLDRNRNVLTARVDKLNHLKMKEVHFVVEMFVVLRQGRRAQLSVARFTQVRGAASSFRKVVDAVEESMRGKGWMVEDEGVWAGMRDVLLGAGG